jgi:hypothetical protein
MGPNPEDRQRLAPSSKTPPSMASRALRRQTPEVGMADLRSLYVLSASRSLAVFIVSIDEAGERPQIIEDRADR